MFPLAQKSILTILASFILLGVAHANAEVADVIPELGDLERWTVFSLGGGKHVSQAFGHAPMVGELGMSGNGYLLMGGHATVDGEVNYLSDSIVSGIDPAVS